jgi:hypothetical protein
MPRLNSTFKNMIFFLYGRDPKSGSIVGPLGTGFFVGIEGKGSGNWYMQHFYAVTCWHVAVQNGGSIIRINTKDGKSRFIELEPHEWHFVPGADDLCATDITEMLSESDQTSFLPISLMVTKNFVEHEELEIGEDGFMLGLFGEQPGINHNMVAARFGNISLLAHDDAPIEQPNGMKRPSHIFDLRSRPGFSGSPVFVYRTPAGDLRSATERGRDKAYRRQMRRSFDVVGGGDFTSVVDRSFFNQVEDDHETESNTFLTLLGIHAGQYPESIEARKVRRTRPENDDIIRDRDKLRIPSSMAVVVPSWEIFNLLDLPEFQVERRKRDELMKENRDDENIPEPQVIDPSAAPPANGENPTHREDFMRLVGAAARKPEPKD